MSDAPILLAIESHVAVITLNRPEKLNAFAGDMRERLVAALDQVAASDARVLVITGAGRAFCSGGDVGFMLELKGRGAGYEEVATLIEAGRDIVTRIAALPIPVIAAIHGVAAGAGANLALACDVRLASDEARFGESFVKIALHADWGGTFALPRVVGLGRALDRDGRRDRRRDMLRAGLVQRVAGGQLRRRWQAYATRSRRPATSVRAPRQLRASLHHAETVLTPRRGRRRAEPADSTEGCARSPKSARCSARRQAARAPPAASRRFSSARYSSL
jgi:enoyl-CoA hydratase/carnithine racemase